MKKIIVILFSVISYNVLLFANDTIKIEYKMLNYTTETADLVDIANFLGVDFRKVTITGNINGKKIVVITHIVKDGKDSSIIRNYSSQFPIASDSLTITIKTLPLDTNKVKTELKINLSTIVVTLPFVYDIGSNKNCKLIETAFEDELKYDNNSNADYYFTTAKVFPIIAYSIGMQLEDIINYCALKNASIHPSLWVEKYEIKNYVYFEIKFLDE